MSASVWAPGNNLVTIDAESTNISQVFIASDSQAVFVLTVFSYAVGTGSLAVYRGGQRLILNTDWTETSSSSITLIGFTVAAGEVIEVVAVLGSASQFSVIAQQAAADAENSRLAAEAAALGITVPPGKAFVLQDSAGVEATQLTVGTTAQRSATPSYGDTRINSTLNQAEWWNGTSWVSMGGGVISAANVTLIPAGGIAATDVQAAITELDSEKQPISTILSGLATGTAALSFRNKIINGNFAINQRAYVSGAAVGTGLYGLDRWKMAASADTFTFSTTANKTTVTIPAGKVLRQVVEGLNLQTGTYTLSWEGTAQGKIGAGSLSTSGVTGSITGGVDTTIEFGPGTVANVHLEIGTVATPFEHRPYGAELALCQRYYEVVEGIATTAGNTQNPTFSYLVEKRGGVSLGTPTFSSGTGATFTAVATSPALGRRAVFQAANHSANAYFSLPVSAEL